MSETETLSAVTAVIRDLARGAAPTYDPPHFDLHSKGLASPGESGAGKAILPGAATPAKRSLERELTALAGRIRYLEAKANVVNSPTLPDTPNEFGGPNSPFGGNGPTSAAKNGTALQIRHGSSSTRNTSVSTLLAGRTNGRTWSEEDLALFREHVEKQNQEIKGQKDTIAGMGEQLREQQEKIAPTSKGVENEDISNLQRELLKHQQANEAFQKALIEIGTIITNVANGDLRHKVQIHVVEMDPEITTFKRTINTMMDQLQVFGSEVSRVAREVGTEGNLGGQAQITGVSGIWKELTENGTDPHPTR